MDNHFLHFIEAAWAIDGLLGLIMVTIHRLRRGYVVNKTRPLVDLRGGGTLLGE